MQKKSLNVLPKTKEEYLINLYHDILVYSKVDGEERKRVAKALDDLLDRYYSSE